MCCAFYNILAINSCHLDSLNLHEFYAIINRFCYCSHFYWSPSICCCCCCCCHSFFCCYNSDNLLSLLATDDCLCCGKTSVCHHMLFYICKCVASCLGNKICEWKTTTIKKNCFCGWFSYSMLYICTVIYSSLFLFIWTIRYIWICCCVAYFYDFIFLVCMVLIVTLWNVVDIFVFADYFVKKKIKIGFCSCGIFSYFLVLGF